MGQSKKVVTLGIDWGFLDDVRILGIHAPALEMYRFAYFLNEEMQWDLTRDAHYVPGAAALEDEDEEERENGAGQAETAGAKESRKADLSDLPAYALFQDYVLEDHRKIYLLENKQPEPLVSSEDCDYFLIVCGWVENFDIEKTMTAIEEHIADIFQVYEVDAHRHDALKQFLLTPGRFPDE